MKHRRKIGICPNCDTILKPEDNFCGICGQENHDLKVSVGHLLYETVESITHFDTKLYTTVKAIFSNPGKLTLDFLTGKRARHVHPIRFYVFISFVFFLLVNLNADRTIEDPKLKNGFIKLNNKRVIDFLDKTEISKNGFENIQDVLLVNETDSLLANKPLEKLNDATNAELDSLLSSDSLAFTPENRANLLAAIKLINKTNKEEDPQVSVFGNKIIFKNETEKKEFLNLVKGKSDPELDSILNNKGLKSDIFLRFMFRKFSSFDPKNPEQLKALVHGTIKGISIAMFILMPLVAFLLWIFMDRKKYFYEHLIFSIHIHAIYFLFFSLAFLVSFLVKNDNFQNTLLQWITFICLFYLIISLKKVYAKGWISSIFRFFVMSIPYVFIFMFVVVGSLFFGVVSF
jgi:Protein of unknown function (DUF3667)